MECDFAADFAHELSVQGVSIAEDEGVRRGILRSEARDGREEEKEDDERRNEL
jgi:hypothetical protein